MQTEWLGDHPRVGGGTEADAMLASAKGGPSPRGRGHPAPRRRRRWCLTACLKRVVLAVRGGG